jgi:hypothetical protein
MKATAAVLKVAHRAEKPVIIYITIINTSTTKQQQ